MSRNTNVDYYAAGFDKDGKRVVTMICDYSPAKNIYKNKINELLEKVKATSEDVVVAEIISSDDFDLYINQNYVRDSETGKPIPYIAPDPTPEKIAAANRAVIDTEYNQNKKLMEEYMQTAILRGDTETQKSISEDFIAMQEAYAAAIKGEE